MARRSALWPSTATPPVTRPARPNSPPSTGSAPGPRIRVRRVSAETEARARRSTWWWSNAPSPGEQQRGGRSTLLPSSVRTQAAPDACTTYVDFVTHRGQGAGQVSRHALSARALSRRPGSRVKSGRSGERLAGSSHYIAGVFCDSNAIHIREFLPAPAGGPTLLTVIPGYARRVTTMFGPEEKS